VRLCISCRPGQIDIQMPFGITASPVEVRVRAAAGTSDPARVAVMPRAPRLFTRTMGGKGEAIALHAQTYRLVNEACPQRREAISSFT